MKPAPLVILLAAALAGCGKGDGPAPTEGPSSAAETAAAVAEASTAAAAERPHAFAQCMVCHATQPDTNLIGPTLAGVFGRRAGSNPGFAYSAALKASGLTWDEASLDAFLVAPMTAVPGTRMSYAGLKDPDQRKALIAYLKTL